MENVGVRTLVREMVDRVEEWSEVLFQLLVAEEKTKGLNADVLTGGCVVEDASEEVVDETSTEELDAELESSEELLGLEESDEESKESAEDVGASVVAASEEDCWTVGVGLEVGATTWLDPGSAKPRTP